MRRSEKGFRAPGARAGTPLASLAAGALLVLASTAFADGPAKAVLTIRISNLRSNDGQIGCSLYGSEKGFPTDPSAALQVKWCPIADKSSTCAFDPIPEGTYAVACFHDENKNGKFDVSFLGIPQEGSVASNHAKGFMGPPKFKDAKFAFRATPTEMPLRMSYP